MTMQDYTKTQKPRRVGRPRGSKEQVDDVLMTEGVPLHYFAFLRALAEGLPYLKSADQYLTHDRINVAKAKKLHREQLARCVRLLRHFREVAATAPEWLNAPAKHIEDNVKMGLPVGDPITVAVTRAVLANEQKKLASAKKSSGAGPKDPFTHEVQLLLPVETESPDFLSRMLGAIAKELPEPISSSVEEKDESTTSYLPSIEEFAAQFPDDFYTEKELSELYCETFKLDKSIENARAGHIAALNWLMCRVSFSPVAKDPIGVWFSRRLADQLKYCGVLSLGDAITYINMTGRRWYSRVPGLGAERALRFMRWLVTYEAPLGMQFTHYIKQSITHPEPEDVSEEELGPTSAPSEIGTGSVQVVPVPERPVASIFGDFMILDERGKFRAPGVTTLMAKTDFEAVEEWLGVISLKSKNTFDAYAREVERLMIWVNRERQKTLSDINLADALAFREMLISPPAHWVSPLPLSRSSPDWRPLRGPLSGASLNRAMAAISSLFKFLVQQNYLVANPFASIPSKRDTNRMDVFRSFGPRDQEAIGSTLDSLEPTLFTRRLRAILKVLLNTGLRRDELASAKWSQIKTNRLHDEAEHLLHIVGKGEKPRIIPLRPDVYQELLDHRSDYYSLVAAGEMPALPPGHDDPLIFSLKKFGDQDLHAASLSDDGIYSALKSFFQKVAVRFSGEEYANFELASTHWMRHTFAHEVLKATDNDLSVVKELMGHASISTTGIYLQANQAEQSAAVNKIPSRF